PTVFPHLTHNIKIPQQQIFPPLLSILPFHHIEQLIQPPNNTPYRLPPPLSTENLKTPHQLPNQLKPPTLSINTYNLQNPP
uniref:aldehyde dehydrogenase family protein n=1 Tax=Bacillus mycoides TaxID=1405 RepID=UPI0011A49BC4